MNHIKILLVFCALIPAAYSYTFTSKEGTTFEGELIRVESETVKVKRNSDKQEFTLPKSRLAEKDIEYCNKWAKDNPRLNLPGRDVSRISLRCRSVKSNDESLIRKTGNTLIDIDVWRSVHIDYDWITVETTVIATARAETEKVRLKGSTMHIQASSVSGPVHAKIYSVFFEKSGGEPRIFKVEEKYVQIDRGEGEFYSICTPIEDYYGHGAVAINLATGKLIGVDGTNHQIKQILTQKVESR